MHKDAAGALTKMSSVDVTADGKNVKRESVDTVTMTAFPMRRNSDSNFGSDSTGGDSFAKAAGPESLLHFLAIQLMCSKIAVIASPDAPSSVASKSITTDGSEPTPASFNSADVQACFKAKKPIGVDEYAANLFVPILNSSGTVIAVVRCENKISAATGRRGMRFSLADVSIVSVVGSVACGQTDADGSRLSKAVLSSAATTSASDEAI